MTSIDLPSSGEREYSKQSLSFLYFLSKVGQLEQKISGDFR